MATNLDEHYMGIALSLAASPRGQTSPNPLVGAVIVKDGRIVGQGMHLYAGGPHAEVHALQMAGAQAKGATCYVTLEPCSHFGRTPPCADALVAAGVAKVVIACLDPNPQVAGTGVKRLRDAGIEVEIGLMEGDAKALNAAFFCWVQNHRPLVIWKSAATLDGYIAAATGHSRYVTGAAARDAVQVLRRENPAIAVGIQTVLADDPQLTVRPMTSSARQPLRVVFDSQLRMPTTARMLKESGQTLIYTVAKTESSPASSLDTTKAEALALINPGQIEVVSVPPTSTGRVSLHHALKDLALRGVNSVLLEGGSGLASQFLKEQLIDKIAYFIAPKLLAGGIPALTGFGAETMAEAVSITGVTWRQVGEDLCLEGDLVYGTRA